MSTSTIFNDRVSPYDDIPCGYHSLDVKGQVIEINRSGLEMLGYSREEVIGKPITDFLTEEGIQIFKNSYPSFMVTGRVDNLENYMLHKDGSIIPVIVNSIAIRDEVGNFIQSSTVLIDIREKKQLKFEYNQQQKCFLVLGEITKSIHQTVNLAEVLQRSLDQVRSFLETDRVIIFQFQSDSFGSVISESVAPDYPAILSSNIYEPCLLNFCTNSCRENKVFLINDIDQEDIPACYRELLEQFQVKANLAVPILLKDELWGLLIVHHCAAPRQWQLIEIELLQQLSIQLEIAITKAILREQVSQEKMARKQAEQTFKEKISSVEAKQVFKETDIKFRSVYAAAPIAVRLMLRDGSCVYANEYWQMLSGLTVEESLGEGWFRVVHPEDVEVVRLAWQGVLKQERDFIISYRFLTPQNEVRFITTRIVSLQSPVGEITGYVVTDEDITKYRQIELALRESEQKYRQLFENLPLPCMAIDLETYAFVAVNQAAVDHYGYSKEEFSRMTCLDIRPLEDQASFQASCSSIALGKKYFGVSRHLKKDGSVIHVEVSAYASDFQGRLVSISSMKDITAQKEAQEQLQKMTERLDLSLQVGIIGTWEWDLGDKVIWDDQMYQIYGLQNREAPVTYQDWLEQVYPEDKEPLEKLLQASLPHRQYFKSEFRIIRTDGQLRWLRSTGVIQRDDEDKPIRIIGINHDITEHKEVEKRMLYQSALLDMANEAIFVEDLQSNILYWNQGSERLYGWKTEEIIGQHNPLFANQELVENLEKARNITLQKGAWQGELTQFTKAGHEIIVASRWTLISDDYNSESAFLILNEDITEKKHLERQFNQFQRLESIGTLAAGISHDLNNILTPILMIAQLLNQRFKDLDSETEELLKTLEISSKRGADLVKQILIFAKGQDKKQTSVQLTDLIQEVIKIIKETFPKNIILETMIPEQSLWAIEVDPTHIQQVLMNLIINARDALPQGGLIQLSAANMILTSEKLFIHPDAQLGNYVVVTIRDYGVGIRSENLDRIFDPFFTTKAVGQGIGLGLSTSLGIIKNYGGFLLVNSEVNHGTQFEIYLPSNSHSSTQEPTQPTFSSGKGELIMIVDDEVQLQQITKIFLETYNYRTLTASNAIDAIRLCNELKNEISIILMDIMMPNIDGLTTIKMIKLLNFRAKIVATSGLSTQESNALAVGADFFLAKPYSNEQLLHILSSALSPST